jgi:hypothetical protein
VLSKNIEIDDASRLHAAFQIRSGDASTSRVSFRTAVVIADKPCEVRDRHVFEGATRNVETILGWPSDTFSVDFHADDTMKAVISETFHMS